MKIKNESKIEEIVKSLVPQYPGVDVEGIAKDCQKKYSRKKIFALARKYFHMNDATIAVMNDEDILVAVVQRKIKHQAAKVFAHLNLGEDYNRAIQWYKLINEKDSFTTEDYMQAVKDWSVMKALSLNNSVDDIDSTVISICRINGLTVDVNKLSQVEKLDFIASMIKQFNLSVFGEQIKKDQNVITKGNLNAIVYDSIRGEMTIDTSKALDFTVTDMNKNDLCKIKGENGNFIGSYDTPFEELPLIYRLNSSEDGISRLLNAEGLSAITVYMGNPEMEQKDQEEIDEKKRIIFSKGFTDIATGKHYMFGFQNPSSCRKANFMFVEACNWDDVIKLWCKITEFSSINELMSPAVGLVDDDGKTVIAKFIARLASRSSNSFNYSKIAKPEYADKVKNAKVLYTKDVKATINRPYRTIVSPGVTELKTAERTITPGDGQAIGSFSFHALIAVGMRAISENEYDEFTKLWNECGKDSNNVEPGSRLEKLILKIPGVFQIRHGEKKGIIVRYNIEALTNIKELDGVDLIVPDSVRKFIGKDWATYPLEICNWLKRKKQWVALNPQFIQALSNLEPDGLIGIAEQWINFVRESVGLCKVKCGVPVPEDKIDHANTVAKALKFHNLISGSDKDDDISDDSISPVVHALRTSTKLLKEAQVCNWRKAQYKKFLSDMSIGRLLVPGQYTYMICDPGFLIEKTFGVPVPHLKGGENDKDGEYYFNKKECGIGLFRSPLIHPFEGQALQAINNHEYWYFKDVVVFNGYDGAWDRMGGGSL